jgi:glutathione reductase (NADPH)
MSQPYDVAIIGTGAAAITVAVPLRQAGWSVLMVDDHPFGGTCATRGCDPKKVLVTAVRAVMASRRLYGHGIAQPAQLDWPALMRFKHSFTDPVPDQRAQMFAQDGIEARRGTARFVGPNALEIDGTRVEARHIVLAMGCKPVPLPFPGADLAIISDDFLNLPAMPRRMVTIGGGYIATEFAGIAAVAGAEVTIVQGPPQLLNGFDPDLAAWLAEDLRARGLSVRTGTQVTGIERRDGAFLVHLANGDSIEADCVLQAAGRKPDYDTLNVEAGGLTRDAHGRLQLNDFLQSTSNPTVYAAGDAAEKGPPLTPVAALDGEVVAENLLNGNRRTPNYAGIPSVAFTMPPLARVGLLEEQTTGHNIRRTYAHADGWITARRQNEAVYGYKILIDADTDQILGAHLVGPEADDTINLFAVAIRHGLTATQLRTTICSYPTAGSDVKYMLE